MKTKKRRRIRLSREDILARRKKSLIMTAISLIVGVGTYIVNGNFIVTGVTFFMTFFIIYLALEFIVTLKKSDRIKKIEGVFPDFLQLVASNLRAGMTVDKAMLLSARPEFAPLDKEILQSGRDISTGKPVGMALRAMSKRIGSEKVNKTLLIILSGIRAGGNLAILLEETSRNMRQRGFVEKKAASQVLMYVIFIFLAVAIFAPGLFALSGVLVDTMTRLMSGITVENLPQNIPIAFSEINISTTFVFYFSIAFIIVMDLMASLVLGLVSKGDEKEGLRYLPIMLILSLGIFFALGKILSVVMAGFA
ncbi:MAG: type II secretion system F family protein [Nanoarchaeota archaeon]|nr:type II secretion system F family protein [Nanoarchaeota archaeon]